MKRQSSDLNLAFSVKEPFCALFFLWLQAAAMLKGRWQRPKQSKPLSRQGKPQRLA
jgi:hypothetical protein